MSMFTRLLFSFVLIAQFSARAAADGWVPLFDGRTLAGWTANESATGFRVVDGAIAFDGPRAHLFYTGAVCGAAFKNFELEVEVLLKPGANSGIYFHTAFQPDGFPKKGFEIQLANHPNPSGTYTELKKTGSLYGYRNVHKVLAPDNEWFSVRAVVRGKRVQVWVNDFQTVDYTEPQNPPGDARRPGRRLDRGTFALQGHDPASKVSFRNIRVRTLPDDLPDYPDGSVRFDAIDEQIVRLATANYPLVDFHTHLKGGLTLEGVRQHMFKSGINHGIAVNCGVGFPITNDAGADVFLKSMAGQPFFVGMQAEGREWVKLFSPATVARFDYVFTDSMTIFDHRGKRSRLWINEEVEIPDPQAFMEHLVATIETIMAEEPIDIYVNPTFLPDVIAKDYDALWTPERMRRVVAAARKGGVAIEINSRYRLPGVAFIRLAKAAGLKFSLGINNTDANLGRSEYALEMIQQCGLRYQDFWMPKPDGQKPIQVKRIRN